MEYEYYDIDAGCMTISDDPQDVDRANRRLVNENAYLRAIVSERILVVEDGSVDIDKLEEDGFYVIPYRQGSMPPHWLEIKTDKNV